MLLRLPATSEAVGLALAALSRDESLRRLDARARYAVELVTEEVLMNVAMHAQVPDGDAVCLSVLHEGASVVLGFDYAGQAFDPRQAPLPTPAASLDEARIGGLGLVLVRRMARRIDYAHADGMNRLRVTIES